MVRGCRAHAEVSKRELNVVFNITNLEKRTSDSVRGVREELRVETLEGVM